MIFEDFTQYISAELLVLVPVLYAIGAMLKNIKVVKDGFIPLILGGVGVLLAVLYIHTFTAAGIFTAIVQGILCAAAAVYTNQIIKQGTKKDE